MCDWATRNGWRRIEVYNAAGRLFPVDWLDHGIPPRPFWEKRGFAVFQRHADGKFSDECLQGLMADNPRNGHAEQREKEEIIRKLRAEEID